MPRIQRQDVVVVGLGPAGTVLSRVLADAGLRVTALQPTQAGRSPLASPAPTIRRNRAEEAVSAQGPAAGADRIGGSKHLAAPQSYRLPPGSLRDWPLGYDELLPYYERVEELLRVGPRPRSDWTTRMHKAAETLGWQPFAAPAAATTDVTPLLTGRPVKVVNGTAVEISTGSTGAATGVHYLNETGQREHLAAPAVVVAAAPIATVRLLLLSGIEANVGRSFMAHNTFAVHGWFPGTDLGRDQGGDQGGPAAAVAIAEFEPGGSILQAAMTGPRTAAWRQGVAGREKPESWVEEHAAGIGTVWAQPEQLPQAENRVDLDPRHRDPSGRPVARITFDVDEHDRRRAASLREPMHAWLERAGADHTWATPFDAQPLTTHLYGGARMSADPALGVVDTFGRAHAVPGLVIAGSSTFPGTGGRGPVQTVEALAWRSADRLVQDLH